MKRIRVALLSTAAGSGLGSMGIYANLIAHALAQYAPQVDLLPVPLTAPPALGQRGVLRRQYDRLREIAAARRRAGASRACVFHVLDSSFGFMVAGVPWERTLVTVHDLIPALQAQGRFPVARPGWAARRLIGASLGMIQRAGAVCTDSQASARDVADLTGRTVDAVIPLCLREFPPTTAASRRGGRSDNPAVLHVGNNGFYKNRLGVVRIFDRMAGTHPALRLVLAGATPDETVRREIAAYGLTQRVSFEVDPDDARLATLYQQATLLLFPSLYEGFGWPPLEAMRFDCPVVCSDAGSLPEVTGDAALRCAPGDIAGLAAAALRIMEDSSLAADLVARGHRNLARFDTRQMAMALVELYERLAAGNEMNTTDAARC